jgi:SagB-type dehydrogenase family enzyme
MEPADDSIERSRLVDVDTRFRRAREVVCFWSKGGLTFHNYASGVRINADPLACQILDFFGSWRSASELIAAFSAFEPASLCAAVGELLEASLLECSASPIAEGDDDGERGRDLWAPWNPVAGFFHAATKDVPYAERVGQGELELQGQSWHAKAYADKPAVALPRARVSGQFPSVLLSRRTWRRFDVAPVAVADVATILSLTFGVQRWFEIPGRGPLPFKTSPSGGACHPIEAYLLALRIDGLENGWYHYDPVAHALARLAPGVPADRVTEYLPTQPWYRGAAAIVFMAAVFARSQARYRYARAYRSVLIEAGHLCQTFCLSSTWLGLAPFCTAALADSRIEAALGLDGVSESVLYTAGVGVRPPGVEWALYPDDRPASDAAAAAAVAPAADRGAALVDRD